MLLHCWIAEPSITRNRIDFLTGRLPNFLRIDGNRSRRVRRHGSLGRLRPLVLDAHAGDLEVARRDNCISYRHNDAINEEKHDVDLVGKHRRRPTVALNLTADPARMCQEHASLGVIRMDREHAHALRRLPKSMLHYVLF